MHKAINTSFFILMECIFSHFMDSQINLLCGLFSYMNRTNHIYTILRVGKSGRSIRPTSSGQVMFMGLVEHKKEKLCPILFRLRINGPNQPIILIILIVEQQKLYLNNVVGHSAHPTYIIY